MESGRTQARISVWNGKGEHDLQDIGRCHVFITRVIAMYSAISVDRQFVSREIGFGYRTRMTFLSNGRVLSNSRPVMAK